MDRILVIAYYFADLHGGAVRSRKFVKYWLRHPGCSVRVITAKKSEVVDAQNLTDELCGDLKMTATSWLDYMGWQANVRRRQAWFLPPSLRYTHPANGAPAPSAGPGGPGGLHGSPRRLLQYVSDFLEVPDAYWGWVPFALAQGMRWAREYQVLYSTSPPETGHIVAFILKHWTGKPWVADFRDPWLGNSFRDQRYSSLRCWNAHLEAAVIKGADRVICNTDRMRTNFLARYSGVDPAKFITVWNGFDEEDFINLHPVLKSDRRKLILHTGSLYGRRTPIPFLTALGLLNQQGIINPQDVCVEFLGLCSPSITNDIRQVVERFGLQTLVTLSPSLPYRETLARQMSADLLLLVGHQDEGTSTQIPGKAFEYLRTGRPILFLFPESSATGELFTQVNARQALRADPGDVAAIMIALRTMLGQIMHGKPASSPSPAEHLRRSYQAHQVLDILRGLTANSTPLFKGELPISEK